MLLKEGQIRIPSGCAISGVFSKSGTPVNGAVVRESMRTMHDRSNGLGGGFAGYGIYPKFKDYYALHVFYENEAALEICEKNIRRYFDIVKAEVIPTRQIESITDAPLIWRYFVAPKPDKVHEMQVDEKEYVARFGFMINGTVDGAFVFSSGKNMGVFKAVGYPEDVGAFYRLEEYEGYGWTAHGRYPTNTPGWWGGAHPFALLDLSVVHNGEISSYDANRRYIEMFGYHCDLLTDTEVITYIFDYLLRKQKLTLEEAAHIVAAPFWSTIANRPEQEREELKYLRSAFSSMLITGPFSIILGFEGGMMALNDRLKLRSMVVGEKGEMVYIASEECAIRQMEPNVDTVWSPRGGEPVIVRLNEGVE